MRKKLYKYIMLISNSVVPKNFWGIDSEHAFYEQVTTLCSKINKDLSALARVSKYVDIEK